MFALIINMRVEDIKRSIVDQEEEIKEKFKNERIVQRDADIKKYLKYPNVLAILGVRRCGKSFFSILTSKQLKSNYGYVNFDDPILGEIKANELRMILEALYQIKGDNIDTIILDEIHNIKNWELFVTRLRETKKVIITGSNSEMLSGELATRLTGRHIDFILFPFSFTEYLKYKEFNPNIYRTKDIAKTKLLLKSYLLEGGFPEVQRFGLRIVKQIYNDIIHKDIIRRYKIKFISTFREMMMLIISNFSKEISYNKIKNILKIKSVHTVKNYIDYAEKAFLLFKIEKYSPKLKEQIIAPKKIYLVDHGIASLAFKLSENVGRLYENIVAVELRRRKSYGEKDFEIFYWKNHQGYEVDFVIKNKSNIESLIQVCYDTADLNTLEREVRSLIKASKELRCRNLLVITEELEDERVYDRKKIKFIPLWRWLLTVQ
jgi:hypothetical protein